jgi:hypothetical protein
MVSVVLYHAPMTAELHASFIVLSVGILISPVSNDPTNPKNMVLAVLLSVFLCLGTWLVSSNNLLMRQCKSGVLRYSSRISIAQLMSSGSFILGVGRGSGGNNNGSRRGSGGSSGFSRSRRDYAYAQVNAGADVEVDQLNDHDGSEHSGLELPPSSTTSAVVHGGNAGREVFGVRRRSGSSSGNGSGGIERGSGFGSGDSVGAARGSSRLGSPAGSLDTSSTGATNNNNTQNPLRSLSAFSAAGVKKGGGRRNRDDERIDAEINGRGRVESLDRSDLRRRSRDDVDEVVVAADAVDENVSIHDERTCYASFCSLEARRSMYSDCLTFCKNLPQTLVELWRTVLGATLAISGITCFILQTRENYWFMHSFWHMFVMSSSYFLIQGRLRFVQLVARAFHLSWKEKSRCSSSNKNNVELSPLHSSSINNSHSRDASMATSTSSAVDIETQL